MTSLVVNDLRSFLFSIAWCVIETTQASPNTVIQRQTIQRSEHGLGAATEARLWDRDPEVRALRRCGEDPVTRDSRKHNDPDIRIAQAIGSPAASRRTKNISGDQHVEFWMENCHRLRGDELDGK
jgi:hypothetical protein